jgi:GNAT superfamily N-acetyltransferase
MRVAPRPFEQSRRQKIASTIDRVREGVEIVRAGPERLEEVAALWHSLSEHHAELTSPDLPVRRPAEGWPLRRGRYEEALADGACLLLAETPAGAVGFAFARPVSAPATLAIEQVLDVETVAVLPQTRGMGIGTALMEALRAVASELDLGYLALSVRTANSAALRFYEREGFDPLYVTMLAPRGD